MNEFKILKISTIHTLNFLLKYFDILIKNNLLNQIIFNDEKKIKKRNVIVF